MVCESVHGNLEKARTGAGGLTSHAGAGKRQLVYKKAPRDTLSVVNELDLGEHTTEAATTEHAASTSCGG